MAKQKYVRGDVWFEQQVHKRVKRVLDERENQFAYEHQFDTEQQLLDYIRQAAAELGHVPGSGEVIGGKYISIRFHSWEDAILAAGLPKPGSMPKLQRRLIYKQEYKRQASLFKKERAEDTAARREQAEERTRAARQEKSILLKRDTTWGESHKDDTDEQLLAYVRQIAAELGRSPFVKEVVGGHYIAKRFICWPLALTLAELELPQGMKPPKQKDLNEYNRLKKAGKSSGCVMLTENTAAMK